MHAYFNKVLQIKLHVLGSLFCFFFLKELNSVYNQNIFTNRKTHFTKMKAFTVNMSGFCVLVLDLE